MNRTIRRGLLVVLCLVAVASVVLTGCGKKEAALERPGLEFADPPYIKGSTVDFDPTTINTMAESGGEAGFKYGLMKSIYPTIWESNTDNVAKQLFGATYWRGDGASTTYEALTSGDQSAVDATIFSTKLSAAEQAVVTSVVEGLFDKHTIDLSDAKALTATTFYLTLMAKVGQSAADGWKADVEAAVALLYSGQTYADLAAADKQVVIAVADPAGLFYKHMAGIAAYGEAAFKNGVAASTYPALAEQKAQDMYSKAYSALDAATEAPYVNGAVYASLGSYYPNDAARTAARAGTAAYLKSLGYVTSDNYSALNYVEKARVDQAVSQSLYTGCATGGGARERDYIDFTAVPGAVLKFVAEMSDAVPFEQSTCYLALNRGTCYLSPATSAGQKVCYSTTTAAINFKADVQGGVALRTAFYRWLAKEKVKEAAASALLIQQSVGEFYFTVTNPNKYEVNIDELVFAFQTTAGTTTIDGARQTVFDIYLPAEGEITLKVVAPTKTYDLVSWLAMAGQGAKAREYAAQVWAKIQDGSITWTYTATMTVSHGEDIETYEYPE